MLYLRGNIGLGKAMDTNSSDDEDITRTLDGIGVVLQAGFTAKRGTAVQNISLALNSAKIEGRGSGV